METTALRLCLQSLCQHSPWVYAVFWKLQQPHLFLTWEDGYYDMQRPKACMRGMADNAYSERFDKFLSSNSELSTRVYGLDGHSIVPALAEMSTTSYAIGQGVVGEVAYNGVPHWVFPGKITNDRFNPSVASQWGDEWLLQIEAGIKTILLIPFAPDGVLQLGSFETVAEDAQLVANIKDKFAADYKLVEYLSSFWLPVGIQHQSSAMMSPLVGYFAHPSENFSQGDQQSNINNASCILPTSHHILDDSTHKVRVFETGCNGDMHLVNMIGSAGQLTDQPLAENISESTKRKMERSLDLHEIEVDSSFSNNDARGLWDYANEMIELYLDGGRFEPPLSIGRDSVISQSTGNSLSFPRDCELHKALGTDFVDGRTRYMSGSSDSGVAASSLMHNGGFNPCLLSPYSDGLFHQVDDENNLLEVINTNASEIPDYNSPNLVLNASALKHQRGSVFSDSEGPNQPESGNLLAEDSGTGNLLAEDSGTWSCVTSAEGYRNAPSSSSPSRTSYTQRSPAPMKEHRKKANVASTAKRRARPGDHHKPRPRDRQLIQDRIKELRELVPNGAECSIDGLLDKTIQHLAFLQTITKRADQLGRKGVMEQASEQMRAESPETENNGASWAVDLADEKQTCPIVVKDLESPGQMLIEMVCYDYGRFLEIADVIHRLKLSILRGVMDKRSDTTWARFVVEATGNFQRLDLFWPLMQLLQQNQLPIPSKI